jgi:hypothetical protein
MGGDEACEAAQEPSAIQHRANDDSPLPALPYAEKARDFFLTGKRDMCMLFIELHSE